MLNITIILTLIVGWIGLSSNSPQQPTPGDPSECKPFFTQIDSLERPMTAREHVRELREAVLLVRLQDRSQGLNLLRSKGLNEMADDEETELRQYNLDVVEAFNKGFSFCPVLFFYSQQSQAVRESNWAEVDFLDDSLEVDIAALSPTGLFYMAEFSTIQDEEEGFKGRTELRNTESGTVRKPIYRTEKVSGFSALIVKDNSFRQLKKPFPYYVKTYESVFFRRTKLKSVQMLNTNIDNYYRLK